MKVCMIGSGRMAGVHSGSLSAIPGVSLDTVVGVDLGEAEKLAEQFGYKHVSGNLEGTLETTSCEVAVICTPNSVHSEQVEMSLRFGKHVLCEIPVAMSLEETLKLRDLAKKKNLRVMVCHTERFEEGRRALADAAIFPCT